jgi:hypothetical protein
MKKLLFTVLYLLPALLFAQKDSTSAFTFSGYVEAYAAHDFNHKKQLQMPPFLYNHTVLNGVNINLAYLKGSYLSTNVRANLALQAGTYVQANYAAEPVGLRNIFEANAGVRLSKKREIWLDAGVFASHIGFESAISKDCWTLTRSLIAENSPYFESGVRLTSVSNDGKWTLVVLGLNGWQQIQRPSSDRSLALGTQILYKPNDKTTVNYSTFFDNKRQFHNFYGIVQFTEKTGVTVGADLGFEDGNNWWGMSAILKQNLTTKFSLSARYELYQDKNAVIIGSKDFNTEGVSLGLNYAIFDNALARVEFKNLRSKTGALILGDKNVPVVTAALAVSF